MKITGEVRDGAEFKVTSKPTNMADSTFAALTKEGLLVARRLADLFGLPGKTQVLAHWHGMRRTEGFATTVAELKQKATDAGF